MTHTAVAELTLVSRRQARADGDGEALAVPASGPRLFVCRLEIYDIIDQESLDISIWGSPDGTDWGKRPILKFPQRFYRGAAEMALDLGPLPEVKLIRARWEVNRWGRGAPVPLFEFQLMARPAG